MRRPMRRYELTCKEWSINQPLLPNKPRGLPLVDARRVINGILWRFRAGFVTSRARPRRPTHHAPQPFRTLARRRGRRPDFHCYIRGL